MRFASLLSRSARRPGASPRRFGSGLAVGLLAAMWPQPASAQPADTREAVIAQAKLEKAKNLRPFTPDRVEQVLDRAEDLLLSGQLRWHPFFESAYAGGGFTLGAGYRALRQLLQHGGRARQPHVHRATSASKREFLAPRLFDRRGVLSLIGGWREATQVGFYGLGTATSEDDRANYGFKQPYGPATLDVRPGRRVWCSRGGFEASQWEQTPGEPERRRRSKRSTRRHAARARRQPDLPPFPGHGRRSTRGRRPGYARRGGFYGVTLHDFADHRRSRSASRRSTTRPSSTCRCCAKRGCCRSAAASRRQAPRDDQQIPFFMLPALGGGSSLRGYSSWRFRDRNSLVLQAEWRVIANRFLDMALFYDTGKVTAHASDLNLDGLKSDCGLGFRFHGPLATPLRIELAKGNEGLSLIFAASAAVSEDAPWALEPLSHSNSRARASPLPTSAPALARPRSRCRRRAAALLPRRSHRARAREPGRLRRSADGHRADVRDVAQPLRHGRPQAVEHAGAQHQHHRRSARFELVHQPHRRASRSRRRRSRAGRTSAGRRHRRDG